MSLDIKMRNVVKIVRNKIPPTLQTPNQRRYRADGELVSQPAEGQPRGSLQDLHHGRHTRSGEYLHLLS